MGDNTNSREAKVRNQWNKALGEKWIPSAVEGFLELHGAKTQELRPFIKAENTKILGTTF
jgi:hypothetical protein